MNDPLDDIARAVTPQADQCQQATESFARQVSWYYQMLRRQGLGAEARLWLTRDYQQVLLRHGLQQQGPG